MRTIVSGASSNHFKSLIQLIRSVKKWNPMERLIIWNLGFTEQELGILKELPGIMLRHFNYENYPEYFNIRVAAGEYAWKPALLYETSLDISDGPILWLDAGDIVRAPLYPIFNWIEQHGFFSTYTSGTVENWNYPAMFDRIDPSYRSYIKNPMLNGAIVGFDPQHIDGKEFIDTFYAWAIKKEIIAPTGSSRANHRQDQSCLTLIMWDIMKKRNIDNFPKDLLSLIDIHRDID